MGEGAFAVAIAQRPDAGDVGAQLVVDFDVAVAVGCDAGVFETEIGGVGAAADGEEQVGADDLAVVQREAQTPCESFATRGGAAS